MAFNQLGRQVIKETMSGTYDSSIDQDDSNEGVLVKFGTGNHLWRNGQPSYVKTTDVTDLVAGVLLNVSGAKISSTTQPRLYPYGTVPGGRVCTVATRGIVLVKFTNAILINSVGRYVVPSATDGEAQWKTTPATDDHVMGVIVAADINAANNLALVSINLPTLPK